jgi:hypothetical protein
MKDDKLVSVLRKYYAVSVYKGGDILLEPRDALSLAEDLKSINIPIMGITGWYYVGAAQERKLAEDMSVDYYVGDNVWFGTNRVEESVKLIKEFIKNRLPSRTGLISLDLDIPDWNNIYTRIVNSGDAKLD